MKYQQIDEKPLPPPRHTAGRYCRDCCGCLPHIDRYFKISERNSTLSTEIFAGIVNFLANAYLLVIIPEMLSTGMNSADPSADPETQVPTETFVFGLSVATACTSIVVGLLANLPVPAGCGIACAA